MLKGNIIKYRKVKAIKQIQCDKIHGDVSKNNNKETENEKLTYFPSYWTLMTVPTAQSLRFVDEKFEIRKMLER